MDGIGFKDDAPPRPANDESDQFRNFAIKAKLVGSAGDANSCILKGIPSVVGHTIRNWMYIRECFEPLFQQVLCSASIGNVCICGDPGIGKSTFSLYVFMRLVQLDQNVVRISMGNAMLVHSKAKKCTYFEGHIDDSLVRNKDYWLLVDGNAKTASLLDRNNRGIIFASPKKENYHTFVKESQYMLYMPPWSFSEVKALAQAIDYAEVHRLVRSWLYPRTYGADTIVTVLDPGNSNATNLKRTFEAQEGGSKYFALPGKS